MTRHGDPGPCPEALQYGRVSDQEADALLAEMLSFQDERLVNAAVNAENWMVFERQSNNPLYYKRATKKHRVSLGQQAAYFRRRVWWFVQHSPMSRLKFKQEEESGSQVSTGVGSGSQED